MIVIYEPPVRNSGIIGGKFLERTRVAKPSSSPENPIFYGPQVRHTFITDSFCLTFNILFHSPIIADKINF